MNAESIGERNAALASSSTSMDVQDARPSSSYRPSPSPSATSQSDDPDREDDDEVEDDDDEDYTDVAGSAFQLKDRRNTLKARGSAALVPKVNTSETWSMTPANARNASAATLPHEILLHIFKYVAISPPDLRRSLTVCKAWCLCGVELLWHRPSFYRISSLFKLIHIIRRPDQTFPYANFVRRLNLSLLANDLEDSLFGRMAVCTRLERLTLTGCTMISDDTIASVLQHTKHLVAADFSDVVQLTDKSVMTIAENCPRLQGINLTGCKNVTSASIAQLAKSCKLLRRVKLCGCELIGDEALAALAECCPVLLEVDLINCPLISDASVRRIWQYSFHMRELRLAQCGKLTDLAFPAPPSTLHSSAAGRGVTGSMAAGHAASLQQSMIRGSDSAPTSRGVSPTGNMGEGHARPLVFSSSDDALPRIDMPMHTHLRPSRMFDHLRILDLTNCNTISDASIEGIVSNVPRIRNLILAKCTRLTNESAYSIARLGKNLHYLHLGHVSNLTDRAVCHLARSCTRLRYIDLACCPQLTDLSVLELAANLPKLRRIGLVRVSNLTDQAIYGLVERYTSLERIHLSYCENISVPAIFWLLERLNRLTHLSLTGVPAFRRPELQSMCREPPREFNAHQRAAFCVYSGKGVNELRKFLQGVYTNEQTASQFGDLSPEVHSALTRITENRERRMARYQQQQQQNLQQPPDVFLPQSQGQRTGHSLAHHHSMNLDQAMAAQQQPSFNLLSAVPEPMRVNVASAPMQHGNQIAPMQHDNGSRPRQPNTSYREPVLHNMDASEASTGHNTENQDDYDEQMEEDDVRQVMDAEHLVDRQAQSSYQTPVAASRSSSTADTMDRADYRLPADHGSMERAMNGFGFGSLGNERGTTRFPRSHAILNAPFSGLSGPGQVLGSAPASSTARFDSQTPQTNTAAANQTRNFAALATPPLSSLAGSSMAPLHPMEQQPHSLETNPSNGAPTPLHDGFGGPDRLDPDQTTPIATLDPFHRQAEGYRRQQQG